MDGYGSVSSACLSLLGAGGRGLLSLRPSSTTTGPSSSASSLVFHASFAVLRLALLWLVTSALLRNYRRARAELYRPVVDLQDYEMVELFLRRLKMWMGLSRTKEVGALLVSTSCFMFLRDSYFLRASCCSHLVLLLKDVVLLRFCLPIKCIDWMS